MASEALGSRLTKVLDHLGIARAHFGVKVALDVAELLTMAPERVASLTFQGANTLRPGDIAAFLSRTLCIQGDAGPIGRILVDRLGEAAPARVHWLKDYDEYMWSDVVSDRTQEVGDAIVSFLAQMDEESGLQPVSISGKGNVDGISFEAQGSGTPLVLLPLQLAPHQWHDILPALREHHCTIVLGGPHLRPVANLEGRAAGGFDRVAFDLLALTQPDQRKSYIEVGCGSGALLRRFAQRTALPKLVGLDINPFLLREAKALAEDENVALRLDLREGSAEAIPFPDNSFDIVYSNTVMEEVDADLMLSEMIRIAKPGGRVAVGVRAVDRPQWSNLPLPSPLKEKFEMNEGAGVGPRGCADESLYARFGASGLIHVSGGPIWGWGGQGGSWWDALETQALGSFTQEERSIWNAAIAQAAGRRLPLWIARPFHAAVGTKPQ